MLITLLKGRTRSGNQARTSARTDRRSTSTSVDISGPLPGRPGRQTSETRRVMQMREVRPPRSAPGIGPTEMSRLPRELDPFEDDFPWIGWTEPQPETVVTSDRRSPTFERDLQRVLSIFAN